jgi:uncharacterized NAD(P)/FAD-binding protein YdhS
VWRSLSLGDRARFLRHLRPWWDVHRHRMSAPVADRIDAVRASGQLRVLRGRICGYRWDDEGVEVAFSPRGASAPATLRVARVVNCSGPACDYDRMSDPLVRSLLRDGLVRPDPLHLGLDVTDTCALLDRHGGRSGRLFAVGPATRGTFWEITAVPDIRGQCEALAVHLATALRHAG